jgi:AAHS family 4-hydroxybenzoate transporter-like MFS transporter
VSVFALGSVASAYVTSLGGLEILRLITGIGLGAAMPNAITLLSEYCPENKRSTIVNTMFCGFPLGAAIGGFVAAWLIPHFGWRSTFLFGGIAPLVLVVLMIFFLPESVRYLVSKKRPVESIRKILVKIHPDATKAESFVMTESKAQVADKGGISVVLSKNYVVGSVLLWISYFMGLVIFYGVINWMPVLFREINMTQGTASVVTGLFAIGGLGAIFSGWLMDRFNANKLLSFLNLLTAVAVALIGVTVNMSMAVLIVMVLFAGIVMNTAQSSLPALATEFYPTQGRTTGVSWMLGIGRFGGIAGSFLVAQLVAKGLNVHEIFYVLGIPALVTVVCLVAKQIIYKEKAKGY